MEKNLHITAIEANKTEMNLWQLPNMTNEEYLEKFKSFIEVLRSLGVSFADYIGPVMLHLQNADLSFDRATDEQKRMSRNAVKD